MSKTTLPTESLEVVQREVRVNCNNAGDLKYSDFSKARAVISKDDTDCQSTISKGHCNVEENQRDSGEIMSSVINGISQDEENLTYSPNVGFAADSRTKLLQGQTSSKFFENEYFKIQRSKTAGLGAIATKDLKEGDVILRERPLFTANASSVFEAFAKLTGHDKDVAMSLHANALLKPGTPRIQAVWKTNW
ncbi:hypothetical protein E4U55_002244 [Claviceps digitariae]|nr:hypothetical protein E4U55_002244 [Claviceps digitariae]